MSIVDKILAGLFGDKSEKDIREIQPLIDKINAVEVTGKQIALISVSYHDEMLNNLIRCSRGITIISEDYE